MSNIITTHITLDYKKLYHTEDKSNNFSLPEFGSCVLAPLFFIICVLPNGILDFAIHCTDQKLHPTVSVPK